MHLLFHNFLEQMKAPECMWHGCKVPRLEKYYKIPWILAQGSSGPPLSQWSEDTYGDMQVCLDAG